MIQAQAHGNREKETGKRLKYDGVSALINFLFLSLCSSVWNLSLHYYFGN